MSRVAGRVTVHLQLLCQCSRGTARLSTRAANSSPLTGKVYHWRNRPQLGDICHWFGLHHSCGSIRICLLL